MTIIDEYLTLTKKYKKDYSEKTILLMQVGSFFECYALIDKDGSYYGSNIQDFADINDFVISRKNVNHKGIPVVMAGFGITQLEKYVRRLQENDYTIVVYTQDSQTKNTTRSLSCIFSPGTFFSNDSTELSNITTCIWIEYSKNNQCFSEKIHIAASSIDIYTGYSNLYEYSLDYIKGPSIFDNLENYLSINNPSECIIISNKEFNSINDIIKCKTHKYDYETDWVKNIFKQKYQQEILKLFFTQELFTDYSITSQCYTFLLQFLYNHNPSLVKKIKSPSIENSQNKLLLANHSLKQLNIISDSRYTGKYSSLSIFLNNCITTMGKRAFNYHIKTPITNANELNKEYNITEYLLNNNLWTELRSTLSGIKDLSKIYRKLILGKFTPRDYFIINNTLNKIIELFSIVKTDSTLYTYINFIDIDKKCIEIQNHIIKYLNLDNCKNFDDLVYDKLSTTNFNFELFNIEYSEELSNYYNLYNANYNKLEQIRCYLQHKIKYIEQKQNVKNDTEYVKIHETPKSDPCLVGTTKRLNLLKKEFDIQQTTLSDGLDLIDLCAIEIKNHNGSNSMISSKGINSLSKQINISKEKYINKLITVFSSFSYEFIDKFELQIQSIIDFIIKCDLCQNKCYIAKNNYYCKPNIIDNEKSFINFTELRHPLIEKINQNEIYVSNDLNIGDTNYLLYGTNAVGKTSFIKSIGIAIIMAQAGLFVPATTFTYSMYNKLFTRILGNDNLFKGLSTFAVEMIELRSILKMADNNSLVLGDELCSGTESTSALSIFTAGVKYLSNKQSSFIFATHFHEVIKYSEIKEIKNLNFLHMSVIYNKSLDTLIYDRKLKFGPGENMYGLEVCKSLNLPDDFLELAHEIRKKYSDEINIIDNKSSKYNSKKIKGICELCKLNIGTDVHHLEYQINCNNGSNYKKSIKNHKANLINICEDCHNNIHVDDKQFKIYKTFDGYKII